MARAEPVAVAVVGAGQAGVKHIVLASLLVGVGEDAAIVARQIASL
jgi:hypothetical protein